MDPAEINRYYLQVLKKGETPKWPRPEDQLIIGSQDLDPNYTQYWAYHQDSSKTSDDLPPAEVVASENQTPKPAILVDQPRPLLKEDEEDVLDLILVKDGHAFFYTSSSIATLKSNIENVLDEAVNKFNMTVEHFMTTSRVSEEVEKALDDLEDTEIEEAESVEEEKVEEDEEEAQDESPESSEEEKEDDQSVQKDLGSYKSEPNIDPQMTVEPEKEPEEDSGPKSLADLEDKPENQPQFEDSGPSIRHVNTQQLPSSGIYLNQNRKVDNSASGGSNKLLLLIPISLLLLAATSIFMFKDRLFSVVTAPTTITPTPTPEPAIPTPTPVQLDRSEFKVRVLNGTTTSGAAKALGDTLKEKGWSLDKVGNNSDQKVSKGYIRYKEDNKSASEVLINDLGSGYTASDSGYLKSTDTADLEVVIGAE